MIEIIKAAFTAGEVKTFLIQGEYVEILEAAYPVDVAMMDRSGAQLSTMRNAEASYFSRPGKYEVIQVTSAKSQTVRLFVGSGDAGTRRTSGDVSVIDGGKNQTLANNVFSGYGLAAAVAAQSGYVQLWNPPASGKRLIIEAIRYGSATATMFYFGFYSAALTTLARNSPSYLSGGANSIAEIRTENNALYLPSATSFTDVGPANVGRQIQPKKPIVVLPGFGFLACSGGSNQDIFTNFEHYEEAI